jgi:hypothetical protein
MMAELAGHLRFGTVCFILLDPLLLVHTDWNKSIPELVRNC